MSIKVGDSVRFLNSVGGGRVSRITDGLVYVEDEDGFETPMPPRECVVVAQAPVKESPVTQKVKVTGPVGVKDNTPKTSAPQPTVLPIIETATGNKLNVVLGFEPQDISTLSRTDFDAYIVNDSNYYLYLSLASRSREAEEWTHLFDGLIEPNIQEFVFTLEQAQLPHFDRLLVQFTAFKRDKSFAAKESVSRELKPDPTRFARLHCFRPNPYFDSPVISFDILCNDKPVVEAAESVKELERELKRKAQPTPRPQIKRSTPSSSPNEPLVVDLHASELLDSTAGLSTADILNMQIDRFTEVMQQNLRNIGKKIIFIHGKGEGILRQALMKELKHRFKGHDVQDASFREYGFGATQVTIRNTKKG